MSGEGRYRTVAFDFSRVCATCGQVCEYRHGQLIQGCPHLAPLPDPSVTPATAAQLTEGCPASGEHGATP